MAERATIFQGVQVGPEVTPGTGVAANKALGSLSIEPSMAAEVKTFRPMGTKFPTIAALGKEWVNAKMAGQPSYGELVYVFSSLVKKVTPTRNIVGTGLSYTWVFSPDSKAADDVVTYTVEQGGAVRAHKFVNGLITGSEFNFGRNELGLSGSMIGKALQDNSAMTAGPTAVELVPVLPTQVSVYLADTQAGLAGAPALARPLGVSWGLTDRFGPLWVLNAANSSFAATVETEPKLNAKLKLEADAEGMGPLVTLRSGATKFLRIKCEGAVIETIYKYLFQIDMAVKVTEPSDFSDEDGVFATEWGLAGVHDATWGKAFEVTVVNQVAAL